MSRQTSILARLRSSKSESGDGLRGPAGITIASAVVFLLVAGIGAATSYWRDPPAATETTRPSSSDETLARLEDYTRSAGAKKTASAPPAGKMLPDVNTMIEKLAARLESAPDDVKGWRMLGWSYYNTERYDQAASAYAKAVALDPSSAELKRAYEEAKAKASGGDRLATAPHAPPTANHTSGDGPSAKEIATFEAMPEHERSAAIKSMVDGLADRLERSPHDVEGWTRLMRSRVVLGEREVAATAFRKALEVFKDDTAASARITAAGIEFGLKVE